MTIEADHYEQARQRFMRDPIVIQMVKEIPWDDDTVADALISVVTGNPTYHFMLRANEEYRRRGGKDGAHIGAIAEAMVRLKTSSSGTQQ